jgi:hypothetical protein
MGIVRPAALQLHFTRMMEDLISNLITRRDWRTTDQTIQLR